MNLTTIHHYENHSGQTIARESTYRIERGDDLSVVVRVKVHKDRSYANQGWARLDIWNGTDFVELFTADKSFVYTVEPWETEDSLLASLGRFLQLPFDQFDTQQALAESHHIDAER